LKAGICEMDEQQAVKVKLMIEKCHTPKKYISLFFAAWYNL